MPGFADYRNSPTAISQKLIFVHKKLWHAKQQYGASWSLMLLLYRQGLCTLSSSLGEVVTTSSHRVGQKEQLFLSRVIKGTRISSIFAETLALRALNCSKTFDFPEVTTWWGSQATQRSFGGQPLPWSHPSPGSRHTTECNTTKL